MADYLLTRTGAETDASMDNADAALPKAGGTLTGDVTTSTAKSLNTVLGNADAGNSGKEDAGAYSGDLDDLTLNGFINVTAAASNLPIVDNGNVITVSMGTSTKEQMFFAAASDVVFFRRKVASIWQAWQELYHTGNVGPLRFGGAEPDGTGNDLVIGSTAGTVAISHGVSVATARTMSQYVNSNGEVGSISISGTATSFLTSSDPELKEFRDQHTDEEVNIQFDKLFSCFHTFNWKSDLGGDLVWGFNAWECIDAGLDMGKERASGKETRDMAIGEVYKTDPAVFEDQEVQVLYKSGEKIGQPRFNADESPMMETVSVEVKAAVEHKVSPAGVDQSKAVPILLAKIEQQDRTIKEQGVFIQSILDQLDAAGL